VFFRAVGGVQHRWQWLMCHNIYTKFHEDWFRHSGLDMGDQPLAKTRKRAAGRREKLTSQQHHSLQDGCSEKLGSIDISQEWLGSPYSLRLSLKCQQQTISYSSDTYSLCTNQWILLKESVCLFRIVLTINSDCSPKQHSPAVLCSGDVTCFMWGTNWIFICKI
jgi:hypothetical protein